MPTLGFHLESAFSEGNYSQAGAILILFYLLVASINIWLKPKALPILIVMAWFYLPDFEATNWPLFVQFLTNDIWPAPLRNADDVNLQVVAETLQWYSSLMNGEVLKGVINTIVLTQIALVASAILTLMLFPLNMKLFVGSHFRVFGQGFLIVLRSTPEVILAFVFLLLFGPSMLPAVLALALHNGGLLAS
ncbi:hypothetical protein [Vibrio variabilis]|uniref:hypothetical protein n=1 Tax=Vibrio variabilis TaxID=990271 RepID=UPI001EFA0B3D|nr:hypothetical protein [Vibrio variabilis]